MVSGDDDVAAVAIEVGIGLLAGLERDEMAEWIITADLNEGKRKGRSISLLWLVIVRLHLILEVISCVRCME